MIEQYFTPQNLALFGAGFVIGLIVFYVISIIVRGRVKNIAEEIFTDAETKKLEEMNAIVSGIKESFGELSYQALSRNTDEFLKLAEQSFKSQAELAKESLSKQSELGGKDLEKKKELIDQTLVSIKEELGKVQKHVTEFEKDREEKYGRLTMQLSQTAERVKELTDTTSSLRSVLANAKKRGQWGERMAEDILAFIGFREGVNYLKQTKSDAGGTIPDYTFILPNGLKVNMDVKFPFDNYLKYVEADTESEKSSYKSQFLKDTKDRIKEVSGRSYINPEDSTIDYVIVFIPNEQIYTFIQENDGRVIDTALESKVILCSPITLYAVLSVIRQAVENFNISRTTGNILSLMGRFKDQWDRYTKSYEALGKKIDDVRKEYDALTSTRSNMLDAQLKKIEKLRNQRNIPIAALEDETVTITEDSEDFAEDDEQEGLFRS